MRVKTPSCQIHRRAHLSPYFAFNIPVVKIKLEQSRYRPGVAQRVPGSFPDFMTTAQDGGKVVSLTHRLPLPPGNARGTHFC